MRFSLDFLFFTFLNALLLTSSVAQEDDLVNGKYCNAFCRVWMGLPQHAPLQLQGAQTQDATSTTLSDNPGRFSDQDSLSTDVDRNQQRHNFTEAKAGDQLPVDTVYDSNYPRRDNAIIPWIETRRLLQKSNVVNGDRWDVDVLRPFEDHFSTILGLSRSVFGSLVRPLPSIPALSPAEATLKNQSLTTRAHRPVQLNNQLN